MDTMSRFRIVLKDQKKSIGDSTVLGTLWIDLFFKN